MEKLIFVYNANSGKRNAVMDSFHKLMDPNSYECELCALTHGFFSEKTSWKNFRKNLKYETEFFYKDEFQKTYASKFGYKFEFPVILVSVNENLEILISKPELSKMENCEELAEQISFRLNNF